MIERVHTKMNIAWQCQALGISRSVAYYLKEATVQERDILVLEHIRSVLERLPFYGYRKVAREICAKHMPVTEKQVRRIMARAGLQAIFPGRNLSKARQEHKKYPYLLAGKKIRYPNQVWSTDLTYIKLPSGHVYLMAIIDLYLSRPVIYFRNGGADIILYIYSTQEVVRVLKGRSKKSG